MNSWYQRRRKKEEIPNPRDRVKRKEFYDGVQLRLLRVLQAFVFAEAILILLEVSR